jgi:hypothetical protein
MTKLKAEGWKQDFERLKTLEIPKSCAFLFSSQHRNILSKPLFRRNITGGHWGKQEPSLKEPGAGRVSQKSERAHGGGVMKQLGKWMLGAAVVAGTLGLGASTANAAQVRFGVVVGGGPVAYVPPCPGPGYQWTAGYYSGGYWVPGRWAYAGASYYNRDDYRYRVNSRDYDRDRDHRDWDRDRDHDRGEHRGSDRNGDHFRR